MTDNGIKVVLVYVSAGKTIDGRDDPFVYAPVSLLSLREHIKAYAPKDAGVDVSLLTFKADTDIPRIAETIKEQHAALIGFSCYVWNIERSMAVAEHLAVDSTAWLIAGGPEAYGDIMERYGFLHYCVRGDGEAPLLHLVESLVSRKSPDPDQGLVARNGVHVSDAGGNGFIKDINSLPQVFTQDFVKGLPQGSFISYLSERGCFSRCRYCTWNQSHRRRDIATVEKELKILLASEKIDTLSLADADCSFDLDRTKRILTVIGKHNVRRIPVSLFFGFLNVDDEVLDMFRRNDFNILTGLQTNNPEALLLSNRTLYLKKRALENIEASINKINRARLSISFINGLPGDNFDTISESVRWSQRLGMTSVTFFELLALPGSDFRNHADKYGIEYSETPFYNVLRSSTFSASDMEKTRCVSLWANILYPMFTMTELIDMAESGIYVWDVAALLPQMSPEKLKTHMVLMGNDRHVLYLVKQEHKEILSKKARAYLAELASDNIQMEIVLKLIRRKSG